MPKRSHGRSRTPEYVTWSNMISRCEYTNRRDFKHYGGRGIRVCQRWRSSFEAFLEDMGYRPFPRASLDRINQDGDYCKENCRWATQKEQSRNRKNNVLVTVDGITKTMGEWAEINGVDQRLIRQRLLAGWPPQMAVSGNKFHRSTGMSGGFSRPRNTV